MQQFKITQKEKQEQMDFHKEQKKFYVYFHLKPMEERSTKGIGIV